MISLQLTIGDKQLRAPESVHQRMQMSVSYLKQEGFGREAWKTAESCVLVSGCIKPKNNFNENVGATAEDYCIIVLLCWFEHGCGLEEKGVESWSFGR